MRRKKEISKYVEVVMNRQVEQALANSWVSTTKLENNINKNSSESSKGEGKSKVVLISPGSFSPIHVMHVHMMEIAKQYVEGGNFNGRYEVVAGYMSPAHNNYIHIKLGNDFIPFKDRCNMIELTLQHSNWISLTKWEGMQGDTQFFEQVLLFHDEYISRKFPGEEIEIMLVCGADLAATCGGFPYGLDGYKVIILGRPGYTSRLMQSNIKTTDQRLSHLVPGDLLEVSSTEIRKRLKNDGDLNELMAPEAAHYLKTVYKEFE